MNFIMNDRKWLIKEVSQKEMMEYYNEEGVGYYYGQTHFQTQEIWIDEDLSKEQKIKTLYHELMHCYLRMYIVTLDQTYDEESLCDISSNAHNIIDNIAKKYFKEG